jgi:ubiquinone/menaquinone biosynthesis C-methylase UbiE
MDHAVELTERQRREIEYHRAHAQEHEALLTRPFSWDVTERPQLRWWNAYWQMYAYLARLGLTGKRVLVVGCGFGDDALRLARMGGDVSAFDLSHESLAIARKLADRERMRVRFDEMPAERLRYPDAHFDVIVARDILHHVDIPPALAEIGRVARDGATLVVNEIYSHSITERVRRAPLVERTLYPALRRFVYARERPYITADERKLTQADLAQVTARLARVDVEKHFNMIVTRLVPDRFEMLARVDRLAMIALRPVGRYLAGRVLIAGPVAR